MIIIRQNPKCVINYTESGTIAITKCNYQQFYASKL